MQTANIDRRFATLVAVAAVVGLAVAGPAPAMAGSKNKASVKILNKSDWALDHLYLSAIDEREWGPDQLGKATIEPGASFTLTDIDCDSYDIKLVDQDGDECVLEDVDLCREQAVWEVTSKDLVKCQGRSGAGGGASASVELINKSDWEIHHFYLSAVNEKEWGPDQFGKHVLEPGDRFTLTDIRCATYDLKLIDEDGDECELEDVDLCADHSEWKITNSELLGCEGFGKR